MHIQYDGIQLINTFIQLDYNNSNFEWWDVSQDQDSRLTAHIVWYWNIHFAVATSEPEILDESRNVIRSSRYRSLREGQGLVLNCRVVGGKPEPQIHWFLNGKRLSSSYRLLNGGAGNNMRLLEEMDPTGSILISDHQYRLRKVHIEQIRLSSLWRKDQDAQITCSTFNTLNESISPAKNRTLLLDIQRNKNQYSFTIFSLPLYI